jgi:hypothetical protein
VVLKVKKAEAATTQRTTVLKHWHRISISGVSANVSRLATSRAAGEGGSPE